MSINISKDFFCDLMYEEIRQGRTVQYTTTSKRTTTTWGCPIIAKPFPVSATTDWDAAVDETPNDNFDDKLEAFLLSRFSSEAFRQKMTAYLEQQARKPISMKLKILLARLKAIFIMIAQLPEPEPISEKTKKDWYFRMHPFLSWQHHEFEKSNRKKKAKSRTLADLANFFTLLETQEAVTNSRSTKYSSDDRDGNGNKGSRSNGGRNQHRKNKRNNNNRNDCGNDRGGKRQNTKGSNNSSGRRNMCRVYGHLGRGNHEWKDCVTNPRPANYHGNCSNNNNNS